MAILFPITKMKSLCQNVPDLLYGDTKYVQPGEEEIYTHNYYSSVKVHAHRSRLGLLLQNSGAVESTGNGAGPRGTGYTVSTKVTISTHLNVWLPCGHCIISKYSHERGGETFPEKSLAGLALNITTYQRKGERRAKERRKKKEREKKRNKERRKGGIKGKIKAHEEQTAKKEEQMNCKGREKEGREKEESKNKEKGKKGGVIKRREREREGRRRRK